MSILSRRNSIVASAMSISPEDRARIALVARAVQEWQRQGWGFYDSLAEIHYPMSYTGSAVSRFRFPVGVIPDGEVGVANAYVPDKADRTDLYRAAQDVLWALEGPLGGPNELARLFTISRGVAGEGYLTGVDNADGTDWEYLSVIELGATEDGSWRRSSLGLFGHESDDSGEFHPSMVKRMWNAHPGRTQVADSPLQSLTSDCQRLIALNQSMTSRILSRLSQAGIIAIPSTMVVAGAETPDGTGKAADMQFWNKLLSRLEAAVLRRDTAAGAVPIVLHGPAGDIDAIRHITMDRTIDRVEMELRAELRSNIATGLDLPPEVQQGMGQANHWSAWSIGDSTYQSHLLPVAREWANNVSREYLWPALRAWNEAQGRGKYDEEDIRRVIVIADGSDVVTRPNESEDGRQLNDRIVISDKALRARSGADDDEAPDEDELVRQFGRKINNPYLFTWGLDVANRIDWEMVSKVTSGPGAPGVGSTPENRRPADSADPAGAPGQGDVQQPDQSDRSGAVFAAAASGHLLAARKKVGAQLRARAAAVPEAAAEVKQVANEAVLAAIDLHVLDLGADDVRTMFYEAVSPLAVDLAEAGADHDEIDAFRDLVATAATLHASAPPSFASLAAMAHEVLNPRRA